MKLIEEYDDGNHLSEIYSSGFQMCFVSENYKQCHPWVLCKDFMTDVVWSWLRKVPASIYGFNYDVNNNPAISTELVQIMVRNKKVSNKEFDKQIVSCQQFIQMAERRLGFEMCCAEKVKTSGAGHESTWLFTLDERWIFAPPMISMLCLFLRAGCAYNGTDNFNEAIRNIKNVKTDDDCGDYEFEKPVRNDARYFKSSRKMRLLIFKEGMSIFDPVMKNNYPDSDVDTVHSHWGIVQCKNHMAFKTLWNLKGLEVATTETLTESISE